MRFSLAPAFEISWLLCITHWPDLMPMFIISLDVNNPSLSGSFNTYAIRFFSPSWGFALSWNYWFNDAVSVASDLTAAQLVLRYWTPWNSWVISLLFWVFLVGVNATHVKAYGEMGKYIFPYFYIAALSSHISLLQNTGSPL
jgi:amino acid transporter, AAT family